MKPFVLLSSIALTITLSTSVSGQQSKSPTDFIDIFEKLSGKHPGTRKAHASGICASGIFTPNSELSALSKSELFTLTGVPATIRFSVGGGNPNADDRAQGARGMAIQLKLPNGGLHNIVGNSTPVFAAKDPDTFFGLLETLVPGEDGKTDFAKVGEYIATHPSTQKAAHWQRTTAAPYSYSRSEFFGLHTFYFEDAQNKQTKFRWHTTPNLGMRSLAPEEVTGLPRKFLNEHLHKDFASSTISYTINVAIGKDEDTTNDPSQSWPEDRQIIKFGEVLLTSIGGESCTPINFDPNVVANGFKTSDDPVLRMRSPAYAVSFGRRLSGQ